MSRKILVVAGVAALLAVACAGGWWWVWHAGQSVPGLYHSNGRLELTRIDVAVKYPGRVGTLDVQEGDLVGAGQVLAREDDAEARAQLAAAVARQGQAEAATGRAQAELAARTQAALLAGDELAHARTMRRQMLVSDMEVTQRRTAFDVAERARDGAAQAVREADRAVDAAAAMAAQARTVVGDMVIRAPVGGRIEYRVVEAGSVLPAGGRLYSLLDPVDPYLTVFFPARVARRLRVGDEARIVFDDLETGPVAARISYVSPEAQFTPKYVETATEREQLVYRVRLRVERAAQKDLGGMLKAGMTGDGYVRTEPTAPWPAAPAGARRAAP
ncbi:HlyD family secretion protein [Gluconacetobacter takamatsuzukensis]|uniref:HlyD family efflux transporter periplasmic adaptor subunit n=1 Tax=Gluconacetobacter takamatsuzukensis TaxID=1286190 RepID=A0A7W4KE39_9PROT|nr:HlyD family efflux transporter periplasmic adaptor subunit [Gluconacetobacter takamatsuzukensis]MBB2205294.1 HlyD family efflux transporter periplasmic adaptor subunit [Gluconacetobacter takamatsuzukensis]